ncbi:MAG TPA: response regulator, partial [Pyrinomonadaceae bacterium]
MTTPTSDRGRILIVDDDSKVLDLLMELLGSGGYEVATAANGAEAFDLALSFEPDIVISDVV